MFSHPFQIITNDQCSIHFLSYANALIAAARSARKRVWILAYVINMNLDRQNDPVTHFFSILRARRASGCDVRVILDNPVINKPNYNCNKFFMRELMSWKFQFCTPPPKVTSHAKAVLIDTSVLFIGSHNLAASSLTNPLDCSVELRNDFLIQSFAETYLLIWNNSKMVTYTPADLPIPAYYGVK